MLQGREAWRFRHVDHLLFLSRASFTSESVRDDSEKIYLLLGFSVASEFWGTVIGVVPANSHYWASTYSF
jgi:hypothetical protein